MSHLDEARYGRACLLVLDICPFTLRKVIEDNYRKQGSLSMQDFLERKKHSLFHLLRKSCCCRSQQGRITPMYKQQWEKLYIKNSTSCQNGQRWNCPCQHDAKPGITTGALDVTLCCLVIYNICSGVNIAHIKTIREIRNSLIHSDNARLDQPTYYIYWNRVKTAITDLARHVSTTVYTDTMNMVTDLEARVMNSHELGELKKLIDNTKRIEDLEVDPIDVTKNTSEIEQVLQKTNKNITQMAGSVGQTEQKITRIVGSVNKTAEKITQMEGSVNKTTLIVSKLETSVNRTNKKVTHIEENMNQTVRTVTQIEGNLSHIAQNVIQIEENVNKTAKKVGHIEDSMNQTSQKVVQIEGSVNMTTLKMTEVEDRVKTDISRLEHAVVDQSQEIRGIRQEQFGPVQEELLKHGKQIDEHDRQINNHGRQIDDYGRRIDIQDRQIDDQIRRIDDHVRKIDDHVRKIDDHVRKIDDHVRKIDDHVRRIDDHVRKIDDHVRKIDDHVRKIDDHVRKIDDHVRKIDAHGKQIDDHDRLIDEHSRQIQTQGIRFQREMDDIKLQIPAGIKTSRLNEFIRSMFHRDDETNIIKLKKRLIEINKDTTRVIPISPLQERGDDEMPTELLFASVVICEDLKYVEKGINSLQHKSKATDPDDIFMKDGRMTRKIYMLGDAAHGKTTYCIWLLKKWCNAQQKDGMLSKMIDEWERFLQKFTYVFLLQLRYVNPSRVSVLDMICHDVFGSDNGCHATIRHVLSSGKYRSLVIIDGLDEWNPNKETRKQLACKGMPNTEGLSSRVSCFISMRPWVFPTISKLPKVSDKVIEIHGLSKTGIEKVIENVLLNHYKLKKDFSKYKDTYKRIVRYIEDRNLKSFMQIPMLAVICVQIWYKGEQIGYSMTCFYAAMVNMLIERAKLKHETQHLLGQTMDVRVPDVLSANLQIKNYFDVLLKLGKVAYEGLLSKKKNLVFQKENLVTEIGVRELQFALDVGLISQKEAASLMTRNVSVHFFHKSFQEFLAAIFIVTQKEVGDLFSEYLSSIKVIMELYNVILFICGMCPSLGSIISQCVVNVADSDTEICQYRDSPSWEGNSTLYEMYKLQIRWFTELQYGQTDNPVTQAERRVIQPDSPVEIDILVTNEQSPVTQRDILFAQTNSPMTQKDSQVTRADSPVLHTDCRMAQKVSQMTFHVSDIYLRYNSYTEIVKGTRKLLSDHHVDIRSLLFWCVSTDREDGITNTELNAFLSKANNTRSLTMLSIIGGTTDRSVNTLCVPTLRYLYLNNVKLAINDYLCTPLLTDMTQLRVLELWGVTLGEGGLGLSSDMVHIRRVKLGCVNMSVAGWEKFINSVSIIQQKFNVVLHNTNISERYLTMIRSSPNFSVTRDGMFRVHFTRLWPL